MAPIVVEPEVLAGAGVSISAVGDQIAAAVSTLAGALPNGAMAGHDKAGLVFGQAYQQAANALMDAGAAAANGGRQVGFGVQMSATNYSRADASSTIGGGATPLTPPTAPDKFEAPSVPSPFGGGIAEPFLWSMVQAFVGDLWPNGDPAQLRAAAVAWSTFARTMAGIGGELAGATTTISGQQIPEGGAIATHLSTLTKGLSDIAKESAKLGVQIFEFATDVEVAQNAIRDLLGRLSPEGIWDGLGAILSGDALEELQEIADDIRTVLDNLERQVDARKQGLQYLTQLLDESVVALEKVIRREFVQYLGEDVGNPLATIVDTWLNANEGILKLGLESMGELLELDPMRFAYDFDGAVQTWGAMVEGLKYATPMGIALDPMGAVEFGQNTFKEIAHVEEWTTDRPGLGPAMMAGEIGSMFIPGLGPLKGTKAGSLADDVAGAGPGVRAAGVLDNAAADATEIAGRAEGITNELNNFDGIPTGPIASPSGPAIPPSLVDPPSAPHVGDTPTPRAPDAPAPHVPDSTPGDRTPVPTPHASTPAETPRAPVEAPPRADAPPIGASPESRAPATDLPGNGQNSTPAPPPTAAPSISGAPPPASIPSGPSAQPSYEAQTQAPHTNSPPTDTAPVSPRATPNGSGPHGQSENDLPSGNADNGTSGPHKPGDDDAPNPPDAPNNPPHTGLHDPPANHATPGDRLPDLTDINNEYRLPNGAVDPDRFDEWAEKVSEAYPTITKEGVEGVYDYTTDKYQGMNPYLRNLESLSLQQSGILGAPSISDMTDAQRASWEAQTKQTDEGLAALPPHRADPLDTTSTTWRGIQASDSLLDRLHVGDTFSDPGYLSTTTNPQVAEAFARANPDATPTLVTVVGRDGVDVKDLSRYMDESEILFPRSTQFEVVFRELGPDGLLRITLRQIDP